METLSSLLVEAQALLPAAVTLRRDIHAHPELGLNLPRTQSAVLKALDGLGLEVTLGSALSSVVAVLDSGQSGPTVLLRGDMDALPMPEDTGFDFASTVPGVMHACGHDAHVAMLAGAAALLRSHERDLTGRVVFMFQPGEEGHHGARYMIDEGVLEVAGTVDAAFAIHQSPNFPSGMMVTKGGTLMASADDFSIDVVGRGGHASMPHQALDPIPIACEIVLAIQTMVTRRVDIFDPAVVTVAHINAGTTTNVIPERASIYGTVRAISSGTREVVHHELRQLATGIASAHGATADVQITPGFPVTVNDPSIAEWTRGVATRLLGTQHVMEIPSPIMGAEDFSYVLERVPGAMVFLGTCPEDVELSQVAPCHSNRMRLNENAMATGIALYAGMALARSSAI